MAMLASLIAIGNDEGLEGWWYPVWDKSLQVYTPPGYLPPGTANLAVGPQSVLRSAGGGMPYLIPDFTVFQTIPGAVPPAPLKRLRMVMECKRGVAAGQVMAGILQLQNQLNMATIPVNDPPVVVGQSIWGIATFDQYWTWLQMTLGAGGWALAPAAPGMFPAVNDIAVTALNNQIVI